MDPQAEGEAPVREIQRKKMPAQWMLLVASTKPMLWNVEPTSKFGRLSRSFDACHHMTIRWTRCDQVLTEPNVLSSLIGLPSSKLKTLVTLISPSLIFSDPGTENKQMLVKPTPHLSRRQWMHHHTIGVVLAFSLFDLLSPLNRDTIPADLIIFLKCEHVAHSQQCGYKISAVPLAKLTPGTPHPWVPKALGATFANCLWNFKRLQNAYILSLGIKACSSVAELLGRFPGLSLSALQYHMAFEQETRTSLGDKSQLLHPNTSKLLLSEQQLYTKITSLTDASGTFNAFTGHPTNHDDDETNDGEAHAQTVRKFFRINGGSGSSPFSLPIQDGRQAYFVSRAVWWIPRTPFLSPGRTLA
ncbi:hypothetical protein BJ138DRAFT_1107535 [Hygrophoropsis aurantiaca]|uniref:Uncharacterized protein n=1 Tax=Hygrophoropsis aurantiaca TaxID=72124 RepID=A0ACB7ZSC6_9AGAM|nr:hypothetical protein BJ138DRAFT_1107535 [Hygrophoropsis aurantiaca]